MSLNLSPIWTHPGLQGQFRVTARRITTARLYPACHMEDTGASRPGWIPRSPSSTIWRPQTASAIIRVWKSRSPLSGHHAVTAHAIDRWERFSAISRPGVPRPRVCVPLCGLAILSGSVANYRKQESLDSQTIGFRHTIFGFCLEKAILRQSPTSLPGHTDSVRHRDATIGEALGQRLQQERKAIQARVPIAERIQLLARARLQ
jgi:hypothetical protein